MRAGYQTGCTWLERTEGLSLSQPHQQAMKICWTAWGLGKGKKKKFGWNVNFKADPGLQRGRSGRTHRPTMRYVKSSSLWLSAWQFALRMHWKKRTNTTKTNHIHDDDGDDDDGGDASFGTSSYSWKENKIVESQLEVEVFEVGVNITGILLGRLNNVDDTESLLSPICWTPFYWAV